MSKVPSLSYLEVLRALQRDGWVIVRQKGSHIRLQKRLPTEVLKSRFRLIVLLNVPLSHIFSNKLGCPSNN